MAQNGPNVIERDFKDRGCIASKLLRTVNNRSDVMAHLQSSNFMVQGLKNESRYTQGSSSFFFGLESITCMGSSVLCTSWDSASDPTEESHHSDGLSAQRQQWMQNGPSVHP